MAAVALCTALVIIVVSVMTGFVDMVRNAGKSLMGEVIISRPIQGFAHYDLLIDELLKLPEVAAATPVIETLGLMEMPYGDSEGIQVYGIEPESFAKVTDYADALYWRPPDDETWLQMLDNAAREFWTVDAADQFDPISPETRAQVGELSSNTTLRTLLARSDGESHAHSRASPARNIGPKYRPSSIDPTPRGSNGTICSCASRCCATISIAFSAMASR